MRSIYRRTQDRSFPLSRISIIQAMMFVLPIVFMTNSVALAVVRFVDATRPDDSGDGLSWATAERALQAALQSAGSGDEIWVAVGTYYPDEGPGITLGDRTATYQLINGVAIYGGFAGSETMLSQRDPAANETILSGDLNSDDLPGFVNNGENSFHVVTGSFTDSTAILDGITITAGNADSTFPNNFGSGMFNDTGSPTVTDCTFSGNSAVLGGGMHNRTTSSPTLTNCMFNGNSASNSGGGMHNQSSSSPTVTDCIFNGNSASFDGGGMYNTLSSPMVTDCTFNGNSASSNGGGMYNLSSSNPTVTNCTFNGNSASGSGGGMVNSNTSNPTVTNCTFSSNASSQNGGGMYNFVSSNPTVTNCTFNGNSALSGGGMYNVSGSNPTVTNCTFNDNSASSGSGGGMFNSNISNPTVTNCTFSINASSQDGGGMYNRGNSAPIVTNCTFSGNTASSGSGGGMFNTDSGTNPSVTNCILWGNIDSGGMDESAQIDTINFAASVVNYSLVQGLTGGLGGTGNLSGDPMFVDVDGPDNIVGTADDDLRIWIGSPAIDAGDNDALPADTTDLDDDMNTTEEIPFDLAGNDRRIDDPNVVDTGNAGAVGTPVVDMGAYEFVPPIFDNCQASFNVIPNSSDRHHEFRSADDFIPLVSDINRIDWTGVWGGQEGGVNCNDNPPDSTWYLTIYRDDGNGLPDMNNIVIGPELPFTHDGRLIVDFQPDFKPTEYSAPVNVTGLIPGNCYWIEILGEGSGDLQGAEACQWNWMRTDTSGNNPGEQAESQDGNGWSVRLASGHPIAYTEANLTNIDFAWCADSGITKNTPGNEGTDGGCGDRTGTYACCYRDVLNDLVCTSTVTLFECILSPADNGLDGTAFTGTVCPDGGGSFVCAPPVNDDCVTGATEILQATCTPVTDMGNCANNKSNWCSPVGSVCPDGDGSCISILDNNSVISTDQFDCAIVPTDNRFATTDGPSTMNNATVPDDCSGSGANVFRADVWWKVVAPCSGFMSLTMCSGNVYDAMMAAYTQCPDGNDNSAPDLISCNDDACGTFATVSEVGPFQVTLDDEVVIRIGGWAASGTDGSAGQGQSQLHVRFACFVERPATLTGEAGFTKDRYISFDPSTNGTLPFGFRVTRVGSVMPWYVSCSLRNEKGAEGYFSRLVPDPEFCDWSTISQLHVHGCEVVPGNEYTIQATEDNASFSSPLSIFTTPPQSPIREFGDTVGSLISGTWTAPDGLVTANDIFAVARKFELDPNAPLLARVDTDGKDVNEFISVEDILRSLRAFAGDAFGFGVTGCSTGTCVPDCSLFLSTGKCCFSIGEPSAGCVDGVRIDECDAFPPPRNFESGEFCTGNILTDCPDSILPIIELVPIASSGPSSINGNMIDISAGGVTVELELRISDWGGVGDGLIQSVQAKIDGSGYCSGQGAPLNPVGYPTAPVLSCPQGNGCPADGSTCDQGGFVTTDPTYLFSGFNPLTPVAFPNLNYEFAGVSQAGGKADSGASEMFGTLLVEISVGAAGTYTIDLINDPTFTFIQDGNATTFPIGTINPTLIVLPDTPNFNWDNPAGGGFLVAGNWDQPGIPSFFDNVFFNLSTAGYTVTFDGSVTTAGLSVGNDVVTFDLGGNQYTVTSFLDVLATNDTFTSQLTLANGTLDVTSPALAVVGNGTPNSTANLILDGAATSIMANELHVGGFSTTFTTGTITLQNGADATVTGSESIRIGRNFSQTGTVNVDGAGSILNCTASGMTVGLGGSGTLNVTDGGNVICESINLAVNPSATGTVLVTGVNSSVTTTSALNVGGGMGVASLTISAGGSVNSIAGGVIGDTTMGDVTITGTNSSWTIGGGFDLGTTSTGQGTLTIQSGGLFDQTQPGDGFRVGLVGQLQVLAGGTLRTGGSITPGGTTTIGSAAGGTATLTIDGAGALWEAYGPTDIGVDGPAIVTISNGGVMTDVSGFGTTIGPDGQVFGGTLNGDYFNSGRVHPGTSPGVLTITGNYTQNSDGQLILEIDGSASSSFDQIDIPGVATLDGKLVIERAFIFTPTLGETFTVMTYASRVGMFAQVDRSPIGNGLAFQLNYNATDLTLEVVTDCNFNGIPDSEDLANCAGDPDCSDCNGNGIPDACDIDQCDRAIDPTCDDCNSNDIPDLCDLTGVCNGGINNGLDCLNSTDCDGSPCVGAFSADTNGNGIPDECLVADGGGGSTNYTDGTNWVGGVAAINDAADSFSATLDGCSAQLILDADVSVDTMNILSCSSLDVSGGNLTVVTTDGVDVNGDTSGLRGVVAAELSILDTRVVTVVNMQVRKNGFVLMDGLGSLVVSDPDPLKSGTLEIAAGGRVSKDPLATAVAATIDVDTVVISGGSCASGLNGGELVLDDKMSLNITGDLIMNGSTETAEDCTPLRGGVTPPPKFDPNGCGGGRRTGTPTVTIGGSLRMQDNVVVTTTTNCARQSSVVTEAQVLVRGDVINHSTAPLTFDWSTVGIELSASDVHIFEVAGRDVGSFATGFALQGCSKTLTPCGPGTPGCSNEVCTPYTNGAIGLVDIGDNATVTFVDNFDNDNFIRGVPEALYVDTLTVGAGASVTIDNCSVYFRTLIPPNFVPTIVGAGRFETLLEPVVAAPAPHDVTKDRYLSFDPSANAGKLTALRVLRVGSFAPWYVSCTLQDTGADGMLGALVQTPEFCDWTDSVIHVRGCEIVPGNEYLVDATVNDVTFSTPLSMMTTTPQFSASRQFGDVVGSLVAGAWTAPDGLVTTNDIVAVVQKFQLNPTAPHLSRVDNDGKTPNGIVASNDILRAVVAFAGGEFGSGVMNCLTGTCVPSCP